MLKLVVIQIVVTTLTNIFFFFLQFTVMCCIPDICRQRHLHVSVEKNLPCGEISPHDRLSCGNSSPHKKCEEMWRHVVYNLWCFVTLKCCKIIFLAIYTVLSRIFCRNLGAFVWRKIEPKIVYVEKKGQISCMHLLQIMSDTFGLV